MRRVMKYKNAEPETLSCADIGAEDARCGFAGSPTSVNKIVSVVLAGGDYKEVAATDEGISALVGELVADHTIG
jgi:electron transfer flavoprotein beta subunit